MTRFCDLGKSLTYQLPGAIHQLYNGAGTTPAHGTGLVLVASPLLSLIKDQMDGLDKLGVKSHRITASSVGAGMLPKIFQDVRDGTCQIVYITPEQLAKENVQAEMVRLNSEGAFRLLAVDEVLTPHLTRSALVACGFGLLAVKHTPLCSACDVLTF